MVWLNYRGVSPNKNFSSSSYTTHLEQKFGRDVKNAYDCDSDSSNSNQLLRSSVKANMNEVFAFDVPVTLPNDSCQNVGSSEFLVDMDTLIIDDYVAENSFLDDSLTISSTIFYPDKNFDHCHLDHSTDTQNENDTDARHIDFSRSTSDPSYFYSQQDISRSDDDSFCSSHTARSRSRRPSHSSEVGDSDENSGTELSIEKVLVPDKSNKNEIPRNLKCVVPTEHDVLLGRGGMINNHLGNKRYLEARSKLHSKYVRASKAEKRCVSNELIDIVHQWNGRFLKKMNEPSPAKDKKKTGKRNANFVELWYEVSKEEARKKASQALREYYITPESRAFKRRTCFRQSRNVKPSNDVE
jgi:hypothetical protein